MKSKPVLGNKGRINTGGEASAIYEITQHLLIDGAVKTGGFEFVMQADGVGQGDGCLGYHAKK